ncbi:4'-phosphopantetheinyl transferase family protein [Pelosinus propionicus]|uniref:4'-phosphopantetheinyl transferase superfamily protein n=1 Tax=Pelosinus propionicus DSM 13327 TaxID=1123291 RepID=A0A1I4PW32_9FIRM|nr:4'-phosphopantetheinyl transferase superfamily protein [Pelosinus propionicus]SFM32007.1 4'-phosphopantetheinyl transferase superfamily protein [Pelosinus propionicus DSM 13327]
MNKSRVKLDLIRAEGSYKAYLCCCYLSEKNDYEKVLSYLHEQEYHYYNTLKFEKRMRSYLIGRFAAKQAISALNGEKNLSDIIIGSGIFNQPIVVSNKQNIKVSITHSGNLGAALAFPEAHPMGIDLEIINSQQREALEGQVTEWEKQQIISLPFAYDAGLTLLWTAKEALSKVMKTGLMTPFHVFSIANMERSKHFIMCYFEHFPQYKALCFPAGKYMCAIVYPLKTELGFNLYELVQYFSIIL